MRAAIALTLALLATATPASADGLNVDAGVIVTARPLSEAAWTKRIGPGKNRTAPWCPTGLGNVAGVGVFTVDGAPLAEMTHNDRTDNNEWRLPVGRVIWTAARFKNRTSQPVIVATFC